MKWKTERTDDTQGCSDTASLGEGDKEDRSRLMRGMPCRMPGEAVTIRQDHAPGTGASVPANTPPDLVM
jgi:hypothetical protein